MQAAASRLEAADTLIKAIGELAIKPSTQGGWTLEGFIAKLEALLKESGYDQG